jgi:pSer/pThr/pTyr-binding forkhead associated (FHA) protein
MIGDLKVFVVGRSSHASDADIQLPASEDTVGRRHLEITLGNSGACHIVDLGSRNGTFIRDGRSWKKVSQAAVGFEDKIRIGDHVCTVGQLLALRRERPRPTARQSVPEKPAKSAVARSPRRNPATGVIE